jgi:hypothetical protein
MKYDRQWWLYFLAISSPFFLEFFYLFAVTGKTYWDSTADESLHQWIAYSLGWELSDWPFLMHNANVGFRDHQPAIPQTQIVAIYGRLFGLPTTHLGDFAALGVGLILVVVTAASAWGAHIAKNVNVPAYILLAVSAIAAVQPAFALTWKSYSYYIPLLIGCGLAITALPKMRTDTRKLIMAVFTVLGFATTISYTAAIPILAITLSAIAGLRFKDRGAIFQVVANEQFPHWYAVLAILLSGIFLFGFVNQSAGLPAKLANGLQTGLFDKFTFLTVAGLVSLAGVTTLNLLVRRLGGSPWFNAYLATAGRGVIGWAIGANLLMLASWHNGLLFNAQTGSTDTMSVVEVFEFLILSRPWLWIIPISFLIGLLMIFSSLVDRDEESQSRQFHGGIICSVIALNFVILPQIDSPPDTFVGYIDARFLVSVTICIPMAIIWLSSRSDLIGKIATCVVLSISVLAILDYDKIVASIGKNEAAVANFLVPFVASYRTQNPGAKVICIDDGMAGQCEVGRMYDIYRPYHDGNVKNKALSNFYNDEETIFLRLAGKQCLAPATCGVPLTDDTRRHLMLGRKGKIPPIFLANGAPLKIDKKPDDIVILELN